LGDEPASGYSNFTSALNRNLTLKWLFPQEKAIFNAALVSTGEVKVL
jgi:hypothetical protein